MEPFGWCLTIVINIALRQVQCPDLGLSYPIAIPQSESKIKRGEWPIRKITYEPNGYYVNPLPASLIGLFVICLDIPNSYSCLHGWNDNRVVEQGLAVSSECYRMKKPDIAKLWLRTLDETIVIIQ